ncbi:MAG: phospho-sugar mutase [Oscillospiraceae bacterium]|nr:phospho-sugar mutase [Oscillospiraceae bacterium]
MTRERELYNLWLEKTAGNAAAQADLRSIAGQDEEIFDRFYRELNFGTAGLRGIMGIGLGRMNTYVVGRATQGIACYLNKAGVSSPTAAIAYDSRLCSKEFARHAAGVLTANGIKAYIFAELMPTPALSYAVRELGCDVGINITASHNPAAYNGYKVYDASGCQIGPEIADIVQDAILETDIFEGVRCLGFEEALAKGLVEFIPDSLVERYLDRVFKEALQPEICAGAGISLVFTPLNGAGNKCVRAMFDRLGLTDVHIVREQEAPDGNFPTCPSPNPETRAALELGLALCKEKKADLLIGTDPDCDRVGAAVLHDGEYRILSGNEVGLLLFDYICRTRQKLGKMPGKPVAVRSLVSTRMADLVAEHYGVEMRAVLTGFRFIGGVIAELETAGRAEDFIFGFEESCGYLSGGYVRDKDAVNAALLLTELACAQKTQGKTLIDALEELYARFGVWHSHVDNFTFEGAAGMKAMAAIMESLRATPPAEIAGDEVSEVLDYGRGERISGGKREKAELPPTDMIELCTGSGNSVIIRPSGTEPKLKIYYAITGKDAGSVEAKTAAYRAACATLVKG